MTRYDIPGLAAIVCLAIATLSAIGVFHTDTQAWFVGGVLALAVAIVLSARRA